MREVISLHVGQAGIQIGLPLWRMYCDEHSIQTNGYLSEKATTGNCFTSHFSKSEDNKCTPNALLVDLDPSSLNKDITVSELFGNDNYLTSKEDAANLFQRGYILGSENNQEIIDKIYSMLELYDSFQGFMIFRSAGGGTGSGLTTSIFETLNDDIKKKCNVELAVYPSKISSVLEPYNTILGLHKMMNLINCSFMVDNEALFNLTKENLGSYKSSYVDVNKLVASAVTTITASIRFEGSLNVDLSEFQTNLVPYARLHFPFISFAPIKGETIVKKEKMTIKTITKSCFEMSNRMATIKAEKGKYVACCLIYRGNMGQQEVNEAISNVKLSDSVQFVDWSPTGFKVGMNASPKNRSEFSEPSVALIANSTSIGEFWGKLNRKFDLMYKKGAFIHWFFEEGMEPNDFIEARDDTALLEKEYTDLKDYYFIFISFLNTIPKKNDANFAQGFIYLFIYLFVIHYFSITPFYLLISYLNYFIILFLSYQVLQRVKLNYFNFFFF